MSQPPPERVVRRQVRCEPCGKERPKAQLYVTPRGFPCFGERLAIALVHKQEEHKHAGRDGVVAMCAQGGTVARNPRLQSCCRREPWHEQGPVAFRTRRLKGLWTGKASVERRMRLLERLRGQGELGDLPKLACIREALLRPRLLQNFQGLFIPRPHVLPRDLEPLKVLGKQALPDPHVEAATAQDVEHRKVLGLAQWMLQGQDTDRGAQAQPRGFPCQRG